MKEQGYFFLFLYHQFVGNQKVQVCPQVNDNINRVSIIKNVFFSNQ